MNMRMGWMSAGWVVLALALGVGLTACEDEDSPDTSELDNWFKEHPYVSDPRYGTSLRDVSVSPSSATITHAGQQISFRAIGGKGPYTWAVSVPARGTIAALSSTYEAIYTVTLVDDNDIIVYDSRGQAGVATVSGEATALVATANPDTITQPGGRSILTATGGIPPYTWTVADIALGSIDGPNVGQSVVYVASTVGSGDNTVRCEDSAGNSVNVLIKQP
jgi:hypothetical protein